MSPSHANTVGVIEFNPCNDAPKPQPGEIIGKEALASRYEVATSTIQRWIRMGIPHHGDQFRYVFYPSETDPWVEEFRALGWNVRHLRNENVEVQPGEIVGNTALGKHYGVSRETIRDWGNRGMPYGGLSGCRVYRLAETDPWVEEYRTKMKFRKSKKGRRKVEKR